MSVSASRQLALYESVKVHLGEDNARTLMELLVRGWDPDRVRRIIERMGPESPVI